MAAPNASITPISQDAEHTGTRGVARLLTQGSRPPSDRRAGRTGSFDRALELGIYVALVVLIVYFSFASPYFLTPRNLAAIGSAVAVTGVLAAGLTVALIAGQLDLSIGANLAVSSVVISLAMQDLRLPFYVAALLGLLTGVVISVINNALVIGVRINSIIATIATGLAIRAVGLIMTGGQVVPIVDPTLSNIVNATVLGIPVLFGVLIVVYILGWLMLSQTRFGWHIYAVGGNEVAASRSGINTRRIYGGVFLLTAVLAALGGVITAGTSQSGGPNYANGAEFDVLTAVLLGGIGLNGGSGRIQRTLAGVFVIGILNNGLTLLSVDTYYQQLARGAVLILAVILGAVSERRRNR